MSVVLLSLAVGLASADPAIELTVYNDDLALVKDRRSVTLVPGRNNLPWEGVAQTLDATSASFKAAGVDVLEQNYRYDLVSRAVLLQKYLGREVTLVDEARSQDGRTVATETKGRILSVEGDRITSLDAGGKILLDPPGRIVLPSLPEGLLVKPSLVLDLQAAKGGKAEAELRYLCRRLSWQADYVAVLDDKDKSIDLDGLVTLVNHSGTSFRDARLKLVAGDVNQLPQDAPVRPGLARKMESAVYVLSESASGSADGFQEQALMEYHLYSLGRTTSILDNEQKQVSLLSARGAKVNKRFVFDEGYRSRYWWWYREPDTRDGLKCAVVVDVPNAERNGMGMPLPMGKVRVYKADGSGQLQFVGEDKIDHTPKGDTLHLGLGTAFDLRGKRVVESSTVQKDRRTETVAVTLRNSKDEAVEVEVVEHQVWPAWKIKSATRPYEKKDASTILFRVPVPANGQAEVRYSYVATQTSTGELPGDAD